MNQKIYTLIEFQNKIESGLDAGNIEIEFFEIADYLMNRSVLIAGDSHYRITECEFYYFVPEKHIDLYAHKVTEQLSCGKWYDHDFGIDLTVGNSEKGIFGGILLRGLYNITASKYINGPLILKHELIFNMGTIFEPKIFLYLQDTVDRDKKITKLKRVLRKRRDGDTSNFMEKPYRFVTDLIENTKRKNDTR